MAKNPNFIWPDSTIIYFCPSSKSNIPFFGLAKLNDLVVTYYSKCNRFFDGGYGELSALTEEERKGAAEEQRGTEVLAV